MVEDWAHEKEDPTGALSPTAPHRCPWRELAQARQAGQGLQGRQQEDHASGRMFTRKTGLHTFSRSPVLWARAGPAALEQGREEDLAARAPRERSGATGRPPSGRVEQHLGGKA